MTERELPETVSIAAIADLFGVSTRQARNLLDDANVKSVSRGRWPLTAATRALWLKARGERNPDEYVDARARAAKAKAEGLEQTNAERRRDLVPATDATLVCDHVVGACAEAFAAIPAMITRDVQERTRIEGIVRSAQGQVARRLSEAAKLLREGGELPDAY